MVSPHGGKQPRAEELSGWRRAAAEVAGSPPETLLPGAPSFVAAAAATVASVVLQQLSHPVHLPAAAEAAPAAAALQVTLHPPWAYPVPRATARAAGSKQGAADSTGKQQRGPAPSPAAPPHAHICTHRVKKAPAESALLPPLPAAASP
ncbi:hypothetical protein cyc_00069 [Cyclospora cayetanensis]|uniref:Uncharacterized protein n=1 Tax=Cyclospora cayetanensis TaxID=88456 RepID=A0A1D3CVJ9_9EIME|nr:hypothetical protein cyc_00069 [Cyclospora cayetanensis]